MSIYKPNYNSRYLPFANKSIDWLASDYEKLYQKNLKENYDLLKSNNWIDNPFTYKFNSHGFRCDEFTNDPTIMFLGCSYTCGIGLPIDTVWPELISAQLNMRCANLAQGGGGPDTAFRMCHGWIDKINPKLVILLTPPHGRFEMANEKGFDLVNSQVTITAKEHLLYKLWLSFEDNIYFNKLKNIFAIEHLCQSRNIKFLNFESDTFINFFSNNDYARDLEHLGKKTHNLFAEHVLTKI